MIDPSRAVFFVPGHLKKFKLDLFNRIGVTIERKGGRVVRGDFAALGDLKPNELPVVGCTPQLMPLIKEWKSQGRDFSYWDRGAWFRIFAGWLPHDKSGAGGMYRWILNGFQMRQIRDVPDDRFKRHEPPVRPWAKNGRHIVVATPTKTYSEFHGIEGWTEKTIRELSSLTGRQIVIRDKESPRPLQHDLEGAHCLVSHGSNAAIESVVLGTPVIVDESSAASLVGLTNLKDVERPIYPDRTKWLNSMAYSQFLEKEVTDGTMWRLLE